MYENQKLDFSYIEKGEWDLLCAVVSDREGGFSFTRIPTDLAQRLVEEIEHMRTAWASPAMLNRLIKEGIEISRQVHSEMEVSK